MKPAHLPRTGCLAALLSVALLACTTSRRSVDGPFTEVAVGIHPCAIRTSGQVHCWYTEAELEISVTDAVAIAGGHDHFCALERSGEVRCWPTAFAWKPDRTIDPTRPVAPVSTVPGAGPAVAIAVGTTVACAVRGSGEVVCWDLRAPSPQGVPEITDARGIAVGLRRACAALRSGSVACWDIEGAPVSRPERIPGVEGVTAVTVGDQHACALGVAGAVTCWGHDWLGILGHGGPENNNMAGPKVVTGLSDAVAISAGIEFTCALRRSGEVVCWGRNTHSQLGTPSRGRGDFSPVPKPVPRLPAVKRLACGELSACALSTGGAMLCWGDE